jgi:hypothetical protein
VAMLVTAGLGVLVIRRAQKGHEEA